MAFRMDELRSKWLGPVLIFLAGLLVGWLAIGWGVWPVTYNNSLPPDLRAAERDQYLLMTAESYVASGNVQLAQERLASWPAAALAQDLARVQSRLAEQNAAQAASVQRLARDLGAVAETRGGEPQTQAGGEPVSAPTAVVPGQAQAQAQTLAGTVQRICSIGLWIVLVLVGIVAVVLLYRRWRASQVEDEEPVPGGYGAAAPQYSSGGGYGRGGTQAAERPSSGGRSLDDIAANAKRDWPEEDDEDEDFEPDERGRPATTRWAGPSPDYDARPESRAERPASVPPRQEPPARSAPPSSSAGSPPWRPPSVGGVSRPEPAAHSTPVQIGEFRAVYRMGEPDYDEAFDLYDGQGQYVGQCGLGLTTPVGRANDQAAALQVWLWDTNDPDTQVKVLMSEAAYRDTALRDQLAGQHPAMPIRPRSDFELESHSLLLRGTVEKLDYAEQEMALGVFAELVVRLWAYKK